MSVIGFDIGNAGCFIAEIKRGGVDLILNENSNRRTPNVVSVQDGKRRLAGEQASSIATSNFKNTIASVKSFIGHKFKDVQDELLRLPVKVPACYCV
jgi:heat shock protein 4